MPIYDSIHSLSQAIVVVRSLSTQKGMDMLCMSRVQIRRKDIAIERRVELGPSFKTEVVINQGLLLGDEIITIGSAFLNDGVRINVVSSTGPVLALD